MQTNRDRSSQETELFFRGPRVDCTLAKYTKFSEFSFIWIVFNPDGGDFYIDGEIYSDKQSIVENTPLKSPSLKKILWNEADARSDEENSKNQQEVKSDVLNSADLTFMLTEFFIHTTWIRIA